MINKYKRVAATPEHLYGKTKNFDDQVYLYKVEKRCEHSTVIKIHGNQNRSHRFYNICF